MSREPLLGTLVIPDQDPTRAWVEATELGIALLECHRSLPLFCSEIQILQYCLMPDHLHSIWYVRRPMEKSIRYVAQGFWRLGRGCGVLTFSDHLRRRRLENGGTRQRENKQGY